MPALAFLLEQFSQSRSLRGWPALIVILVLLFVGGIYLLLRAVIDFRRDRALKHEEEKETDKKKAA